MNDHNAGQLSLFCNASSAQGKDVPKEVIARHTWYVYIDGASRNNPGPSAAGFYILKDGIPHYQDGYFLGVRTNNQAEYIALLVGLFTVQQWVGQHDRIHLFSDSQLLVRQILGVYKVKNELLKPLFNCAKLLVQKTSATIAHVPREENSHADRMANLGLDKKQTIPPSFIAFLRSHDINL